jgi:hypothetical protein
MLDFNHRQKPHELLCELIDQSLIDERSHQIKRNYLGASRLGISCERALQFEYAAAPVDTGRDFSGRILRIFEVGHAFESLVIRWLRIAGFEVLDCQATGEQFGFAVADGRIAGHCDGIVVGGPKTLHWVYPMLLEIKTMNDKSFRDCVKRGVRLSKPVYAAQMAVYQAYLHDVLRDSDAMRAHRLSTGLADNPALFTAINKDTQEIWCELVSFDGVLAQQMSDRGVRVVRATEAGELLPRGFAESAHFECRMCSYQQRCWQPSGAGGA